MVFFPKGPSANNATFLTKNSGFATKISFKPGLEFGEKTFHIQRPNRSLQRLLSKVHFKIIYILHHFNIRWKRHPQFHKLCHIVLRNS